MDFTIYNETTAPKAAQQRLSNTKASMGWIPNLIGTLAQSPETLAAYQTMHELFQKTSFDAAELTVVWQTINIANGCQYCVPAHNAIAKSMKVSDALVAEITSRQPLSNAKLETLRTTTLALVEQRGLLTAAQQATFFAAGYGNQQLLEIVLGMAQKTISNYTNHLAQTPLDEPFQAFA